MRYPEDCSGNRAFPKDPTLPFSRRLWGNGRTRGCWLAGLAGGWLAGCLVACALFRGHTIIRTFPYRSRGAFWAGENPVAGWLAGWLCPVPGLYDNTDLSLPFSRNLLVMGEHRLPGWLVVTNCPAAEGIQQFPLRKSAPGFPMLMTPLGRSVLELGKTRCLYRGMPIKRSHCPAAEGI